MWIRPARAHPCVHELHLRPDDRKADDPRALARCDRERAPRSGVSHAAGRPLGGGRLGDSGEARRAVRERPARARGAEGRRVRDPGPHHAGVGAVRFCARPRGRDRRGDLRQFLAPRRAFHPRALGGGRCPLRGRRAAREGRSHSRRPASAPARADLRGPPGAGRGRRRSRRRQPDRVGRARGADRRGGHLHVHLHLGDDRPAEGLHDPPPQLLRDGARDRSPADAYAARAT